MKRIRFVYDDDPMSALHDPEGNPLPGPEKVYRANPVMRLINPTDNPVTGKRRRISYREYCEVEGNPERHVVLGAIVEVQCPACQEWHTGASLWGIDLMDTDAEADRAGTVYTEDQIATIPGYLQQVARELFSEVE